MQELVHHTLQTLDENLKHFNTVQELYQTKSYEFDMQFEQFLQEMLMYFQAKGNTTVESEVLKVINTVSTVKRGFNPVKMEKIITGKRELVSGFSFNGMEDIHQILIELYAKERKKLEDAEQLLSELVISLYQNGILTDNKIKELDSIPKIEIFWNFLLTQNGTISGVNKKLKLTLLSEDIFLILEKLLLKLT